MKPGIDKHPSVPTTVSSETRTISTLQVNRLGEKHEEGPESLVVEASVKPFIGVLWAGTVVMFLGFFIALFKRSREV